jgi:hypothetical protein
MLASALNGALTSSLMAHDDHWASHAYVACSMRRAGCGYWTTRIYAWQLEALYPPIFQDLDTKDVAATMWGWKKYDAGGKRWRWEWLGGYWIYYKSCKNVALWLFPTGPGPDSQCTKGMSLLYHCHKA